jgi:putative transcriptional regulator
MGREVREAMRTEHHISQSTLNDYASGALCEALSVVAASHLAWCRDCRKVVEAAAKSHGRPKDASEAPLPGDPARHTHTVVKAVDRRPATTELADGDISDFGLPLPLALRLDGRGLEDISWRKVLPGVAACNLELTPGAAGQLRLVRMAPGKALPEHGHGGGELSLVLRGAYHDQYGRYTIGDIADLDGAAVHRPVAEDAGPCICLVAAETSVRYRSWLGRLWQCVTGV